MPAGGWRPGAKLSLREALLGFTQGPAYAAGMEDRLGKLVQGYLADLIVLADDVYAIDPDDLATTTVLGTMVDGQWRHRVFD